MSVYWKTCELESGRDVDFEIDENQYTIAPIVDGIVQDATPLESYSDISEYIFSYMNTHYYDIDYIVF